VAKGYVSEYRDHSIWREDSVMKGKVIAGVFIALLIWLSYLPQLKILLLVCGIFILLGGCWQLDLMMAPALWQFEIFEDGRKKPFLLPFNVPISKQIAYCIFFTWIIAGALIVSLSSILP
jgi:hypothetical protein